MLQIDFKILKTIVNIFDSETINIISKDSSIYLVTNNMVKTYKVPSVFCNVTKNMNFNISSVFIKKLQENILTGTIQFSYSEKKELIFDKSEYEGGSLVINKVSFPCPLLDISYSDYKLKTLLRYNPSEIDLKDLDSYITIIDKLEFQEITSEFFLDNLDILLSTTSDTNDNLKVINYEIKNNNLRKSSTDRYKLTVTNEKTTLKDSFFNILVEDIENIKKLITTEKNASLSFAIEDFNFYLKVNDSIFKYYLSERAYPAIDRIEPDLNTYRIYESKQLKDLVKLSISKVEKVSTVKLLFDPIGTLTLESSNVEGDKFVSEGIESLNKEKQKPYEINLNSKFLHILLSKNKKMELVRVYYDPSSSLKPMVLVNNLIIDKSKSLFKQSLVTMLMPVRG